MRRIPLPQISLAVGAALTAIFLSACESGPAASSSRTLPGYEPMMAKTDFQNIRTTAYTHTESDHTQYGSRNALGGQLHAAGPGIRRAENVARGAKRAVAVSKSPKIGSAAADWGRWPAGTTFRLLSTGQIYRVEDYGWALSGRNTIDLYMANSRAMNSWGTRQEPIQILKWGDRNESLRFLEAKQGYKHVKRMVLELQGNEQEAAALR